MLIKHNKDFTNIEHVKLKLKINKITNSNSKNKNF